MYPKAIESYFAPTTIDEALRLLAEHRDSAKLLAGGQSLIPMLKLRLVELAASSISTVSRLWRRFARPTAPCAWARWPAMPRSRPIH